MIRSGTRTEKQALTIFSTVIAFFHLHVGAAVLQTLSNNRLFTNTLQHTIYTKTNDILCRITKIANITYPS